MDYHRRSIRLTGFDYSSRGAYFITLCTHQRQCIFGNIVNETVQLNAIGSIVHDEWVRTPEIRPSVVLSDFVVMPNHLHGIIIIMPESRASHRLAPTKAQHTVSNERPMGPASDSIAAILAQFKSMATRRVNALNEAISSRLWQRNYYEHIIRDDEQMGNIREYIVHNPSQWTWDRENPQAIGGDVGADHPWGCVNT